MDFMSFNAIVSRMLFFIQLNTCGLYYCCPCCILISLSPLIGTNGPLCTLVRVFYMGMVSTSAFGIFVFLLYAAWDMEYTVE